MINAIVDLYIIRYNKQNGKYEVLINQEDNLVNFDINSSYDIYTNIKNNIHNVLDIDINFLKYRLFDLDIIDSNLKISYYILVSYYTKVLEKNRFVSIEKQINETNRIIFEKLKSII
jgi:hypothetical protein